MEPTIQKTGKILDITKRAARKMAKIVAGAVLVSGLMFAPKARADSIELMVGQNSATIDMKASADLTKKAGVFIRARPSQDFRTGDMSSFGLVDLTLNLTTGLDAVGELQFIGGKVVPRAGVQGYRSFGDFSLYSIATVGLDSKPYAEILAALKYTPSLTDSLKLLAQIENVSDINKNGNNWSTQRIRLGISIANWGFGVATDLTETGNQPTTKDGTLGYNIGGFVSKTF